MKTKIKCMRIKVNNVRIKIKINVRNKENKYNKNINQLHKSWIKDNKFNVHS